MTTHEAKFTVKIDRQEDLSSIVQVYHQGRRVAYRRVSTLGDCMSLGMLLTDPFTNRLPVVDSESTPS